MVIRPAALTVTAIDGAILDSSDSMYCIGGAGWGWKLPENFCRGNAHVPTGLPFLLFGSAQASKVGALYEDARALGDHDVPANRCGTLSAPRQPRESRG